MPNNKKTYITIAISIIILCIVILSISTISRNNIDRNYADSVSGISFAYSTSTDGYILTEYVSAPAMASTSPYLIKSIVLMSLADVVSNASNSPALAREGAPTITISIFQNALNEQSRMWADKNNDYSNMHLLLGDIDKAVIGGANAIKYTIDGLYRNDTAVVAHGGYVYLLSGAYLTETDTIRSDFNRILDSIVFVPLDGQE